MNKEIVKAMNKKTNANVEAVKNWWHKNDYKVWRVLLFPVWIVVWCREKIKPILNDKTPWSEERATKILGYYIPRRAEWDAEKKQFYFFDNGMGWNMKYTLRKYIKLRDRRFWKLYAGGWGYKMRNYLIKGFELEGFTKEVLDTYDTETEIVFTLKPTDEG